MLNANKIYCGDCNDLLKDIDGDSTDCIITDPPYGLSFMGKNWDKAVPSVAIWQECLRVLKPGAFAFVMCIPRQDCLARMIINLEDAGFNVAFSSIYWTYASGFPKAQNLSKTVDKRADAKREIIGLSDSSRPNASKHTNITGGNPHGNLGMVNITKPATPQAKALEGTYGGFQPKPAVEIIIVAMKPLEEKTYMDQALKNGHGCTWLDDCRIPYEGRTDIENIKRKRPKNSTPRTDMYNKGLKKYNWEFNNNNGRFPANVLCEDNALNDGSITKSTGGEGVRDKTTVFKGTEGHNHFHYGDEGSFSRYFSLDTWFAERIKLLPKEAQKTFPWLIVPKASKSERNRGLKDVKGKGGLIEFRGWTGAWQCLDCKRKYPAGLNKCRRCGSIKRESYDVGSIKVMNDHPTCKPIKLMSWLVTLGSREGDTVLDPFFGSGTTLIAAKMLGRQYIGIEREEEYCEIARKRILAIPQRLDSYNVL